MLLFLRVVQENKSGCFFSERSVFSTIYIVCAYLMSDCIAAWIHSRTMSMGVLVWPTVVWRRRRSVEERDWQTVSVHVLNSAAAAVTRRHRHCTAGLPTFYRFQCVARHRSKIVNYYTDVWWERTHMMGC